MEEIMTPGAVADPENGKIEKAIQENSELIRTLISTMQSTMMMQESAPAPAAYDPGEAAIALSDAGSAGVEPATDQGGVTYFLSQLQDYVGNLIYPHTSSRVTFRPDGSTAEKWLALVQLVLDGITGVTSATNVDDETMLATAKAVKELAVSLGTLNNNLTWKSLGSVNGTASIALPEQYNEICVVTDHFVFNLPRMALSADAKLFESGATNFSGNYYISECRKAVISASLTAVHLSSYWQDSNKQVSNLTGTPVVTQSKSLTVYYR